MVIVWSMDSPWFVQFPDWPRGCIRGVQAVIELETGVKIVLNSGNILV
jgi:hypothetical protein